MSEFPTGDKAEQWLRNRQSLLKEEGLLSHSTETAIPKAAQVDKEVNPKKVIPTFTPHIAPEHDFKVRPALKLGRGSRFILQTTDDYEECVLAPLAAKKGITIKELFKNALASHAYLLRETVNGNNVVIRDKQDQIVTIVCLPEDK